MKGYVKVFNKEVEYDFLSGWIKYNRLQNEYSQEALAYGICSKSHLSYFENGKKTLRGDIIEELLKKLGIDEITEIESIGKLRQKFYTMMLMIEILNYEEATNIYSEIQEIEEVIKLSPYNIEYKIYQLLYKVFVLKEDYNTLEHDIKNIDKIYSTLPKKLKYIFLMVSGKVIYKFNSHMEGINKIEEAINIKETPWANYLLGCNYCFNNRTIEGIYHLEKALASYEKNGYYKNAMWCHNYLGICHCYLKNYTKAEKYLLSALNGANYFDIKKIYWHVYTNLSYLYFNTNEYDKSMEYCKKAMDIQTNPLLPAYNYAEICYYLKKMDEVDRIFDKYLREEYKDSSYYPLLEFLQLKIYHFNEDIFYKRTKEILAYYEKDKIDVAIDIKLGLIEYLENKRKYKEANKIYKELLNLNNKVTFCK
ncbi:tetratricopeptide repeat protein [Vallitalea guaymasensis]|uniref:Helix-turn-helix transcriptional regulator n=1 Tax=Vallitalea guaymasensis TaxID=1185412 RepID=A0A8J8MCL4_9FIRM|nr:tetratricopeptide repeat protein [Vallitalea guaymasensis]QUH30328.1 helix-turn-helix transcriptional regulator [Vallitalea guaymasensis]